MAREEHASIVNAATQTIGALQEHLAVSTEQVDVAMGYVDAAIGTTQVESGVNAMNYLAACKEKINEAYQASIIAHDELRRYGDGF